MENTELAQLKKDLAHLQKSLTIAKEAGKPKAELDMYEEYIADIEAQILKDFKEEVKEEKKEEAKEEKEAEKPKAEKKPAAKKPATKKSATKKPAVKTPVKKEKAGTAKQRVMARRAEKNVPAKKVEAKKKLADMTCKELKEYFHNRRNTYKQRSNKKARPVTQKIAEHVEDAFSTALFYNKQNGVVDVPKYRVVMKTFVDAMTDLIDLLPDEFKDKYIKDFEKNVEIILDAFEAKEKKGKK